MNKKQYGLLLGLMVFAGFLGGEKYAGVFGSQAPPPTIALITPGWLLEGGVTSDKIVPILIPLGIYQEGHWIAGDPYEYEIRGTPRFSESHPTPEAKAKLWKDLQSQTFFGLHDETLVFRPTQLIEYCTYYSNGSLGLRGSLSSDTLLDTAKAETLLVLNRKACVPPLSPAKQLPEQHRIESFAEAKLAAVQAEIVKREDDSSYNPALVRPLVLDRALPFDLSKARKAVWVHFKKRYVVPGGGENDRPAEPWKINYYGVFEIGPEGHWRLVWEHGTINDDRADRRVLYRLLGATDVNGDGISELVFEERYYEGRGYSLYELKQGTFVKVAEAGIDSL